MLNYLLRRVLYTLPIMLGVALLCFALVHIAPGDPLVSILPADASAELQAQMRELYGFNQPLPEQFLRWVWRALQGDLGQSIATSRPVATEVMTAATITPIWSTMPTAVMTESSEKTMSMTAIWVMMPQNRRAPAALMRAGSVSGAWSSSRACWSSPRACCARPACVPGR